MKTAQRPNCIIVFLGRMLVLFISLFVLALVVLTYIAQLYVMCMSLNWSEMNTSDDKTLWPVNLWKLTTGGVGVQHKTARNSLPLPTTLTCWHVFTEDDLGAQYLLVGFKRNVAAHHVVEKDANRPDRRRYGVVTSTSHPLRRTVHSRP